MKKIINYQNLRNYTYSNDKLINGSIKGIILRFTGLGDMEMCWEDEPMHKMYAEKGIIFLQPYYNPWCWMNRQTVSFVDEIIEVLKEKYRLPPEITIVSSGESMGGLCALVYAYYAKCTPAKCVANCPVCDLPFHFNERSDLPRTLYSAFAGYDDDLTIEEAMKLSSPLHLAANMPWITYDIFHCDKDLMVDIDVHSKRFIKAMEKHTLNFYEVEDRGHCDLTQEMQKKYIKCILDTFEGGK